MKEARNKIQKSPKHQAKSKLVDADKLYSLDEAIELVKKTAYAKFDNTVEAHFNLKLEVKYPEQNVRTTTILPHGTGKTVKIAVFSTGNVEGADLNLTEEDIKNIETGKLKPRMDFDVVVAEPSFMPKLAKVAKILGPLGMMPNPKTGTVTDNLAGAVANIRKGSIELRNESNAPVIHTRVGKQSFEDKALKENFLEILKTLRSSKPQKASPNWIQSVYLTATMGPSVKVDVNSL